MLKYVDTKEVFAEIPDEITLAVSISGCPIRCRGCHSRYLWEDVGDPLTTEALSAMLTGHFGITCICFMGGDNDPAEVNRLAAWVKAHADVRTAWYSGRDELVADIELANFDYVKTGAYDAARGPLNSHTTNQRLFRVEHSPMANALTDITYRFWK
ncbi:MAG: anaerobic ribonucleoside-triphosphate reductase activating protein [Bacteroidaceae bacterium]|nr:anaerobic ribonucleoside-triphosphate reductase activating protein [Bacteroidaceae bacterium]